MVRRVFRLGGAGIARGSAAALQFASNLILANVVGATGMGLYSIYQAWLQLFSATAGMGLPIDTLKFVARHSQGTGTGDFLARHRWARNLKVGAIVAAAQAILVLLLKEPLGRLALNDVSLSWILLWAALAAIAHSMLSVSVEALKSVGRLIVALFFQFSAGAVALIFAAAVAYVLGLTSDIRFFLTVHILALATAALVAALVAARRLEKSPPRRLAALRNVEPRRSVVGKGVAVLQSLHPFWGVSLLMHLTARAPYFVLPYVATTAEIGVFGVATRLVSLATIVTAALGSYYGPLFSRAAALANLDASQNSRLKRLLRESQAFGAIAYLPFFIVLMVATEWTLAQFGSDFVSGVQVTRALAIGQLFNSGSGLVGQFNLMIGNERVEARLGWAALSLTVLGGAVVGRAGGAEAVAWVVAVAVGLKNAGSAYVAERWLRTARSSASKGATVEVQS